METFFKYQGLGNDFIVLDRRHSGLDITAERSRQLCDRHFGIGADGVLTILPDEGVSARMVVHNADGSEAEMCGNGLRCVVKHLAEHGDSRASVLRVATGAGVLDAELEWGAQGVERVCVAMGPARLQAHHLPEGGPYVQRALDGVVGTAVSMGNPHWVIFDARPGDEASWGAKFEMHPLFVERTNVELVHARAGGGLVVRVWERGVGFTLACGTGACAAVVAAALEGRVPWDQWLPVELPGGLLEIRAAKDLHQVWLKGPVRFVFSGTLP